MTPYNVCTLKHWSTCRNQKKLTKKTKKSKKSKTNFEDDSKNYSFISVTEIVRKQIRGN